MNKVDVIRAVSEKAGIDAGTCDRFRSLTARRAASLAGRGPDFARQVREANRQRPPGLLTRDAYAAYDAGATTLRPYANLLGVDVEEIRRALDVENGTLDAS